MIWYGSPTASLAQGISDGHTAVFSGRHDMPGLAAAMGEHETPEQPPNSQRKVVSSFSSARPSPKPGLKTSLTICLEVIFRPSTRSSCCPVRSPSPFEPSWSVTKVTNGFCLSLSSLHRSMAAHLAHLLTASKPQRVAQNLSIRISTKSMLPSRSMNSKYLNVKCRAS